MNQADPLTVRVTAGPDSLRQLTLPVGRHVIGRDRRCDVVLDDPAVEPFHALLEIAEQGWSLAQLAGRVPLSLDGATIMIGNTRLELGCAANLPEATQAPPARFAAAVLDDPARFECFAADWRRLLLARHLQRARRSLVVGYGAGSLPIPLAEAGAGWDDSDALPIELLAILDRAERHVDLPVLAPQHGVLGIADDSPGHLRAWAVGRALAVQARRHIDPLTASVTEPVTVELTDRASQARRWLTEWETRGSSGLRVAIADPGAAVLSWCPAVLRFGAGWRARYTPANDDPASERTLHPVGCTKATFEAELGLAASPSASAGAGRALVADQIARAVPQIGGGVARVPQPAR